MRLIGLVRLGADAELRYTPAGDPVLNVPAAYNYGRKDSDGKQPTQWVKLTMWGKRAEKVAEHFTKGKQLMVFAEDVHVETYRKDSGDTGVNLVGRIEAFDFAGSRDGGEQRQPQTPEERHKQAVQAQNDFYDDDIPF